MEPKTETRPWGKFTLFAHNKKCTVKILDVKEKLSLQSHENRTEFWYVIDGHVKIYKGPIKETLDKILDHLNEFELGKGQSTIISRRQVHAIENLNASSSRVLEISYGDFRENDEIRYMDKYGRS